MRLVKYQSSALRFTNILPEFRFIKNLFLCPQQGPLQWTHNGIQLLADWRCVVSYNRLIMSPSVALPDRSVCPLLFLGSSSVRLNLLFLKYPLFHCVAAARHRTVSRTVALSVSPSVQTVTAASASRRDGQDWMGRWVSREVVIAGAALLLGIHGKIPLCHNNNSASAHLHPSIHLSGEAPRPSRPTPPIRY